MRNQSGMPLHSDSIVGLAGARVLFLNWRDPAHPQAGGAEVFCWEIARRFAAAGARVTLLTSRPSGVRAHAVVDGVRIDRRGGTYSLYAHAAAFLARNRRRFDAVVDCQNGIPFFSPVFMRRAASVVCVIHHVHQEQFGVHFGWPLRVLGRELEGRWSRLVYGRRPVAVVSPSTRAAVRTTLGLRGPIFIVPNGASPPAQPDRHQRSPSPLIGCIGRLAAHKRMDLLVQVALELRGRVPGLTIEIAGDGPDRPRLEKLAKDLAVDDVVRFLGHVSPEAKDRLLGSAWLTVNPSMGEGWGLGVLEANAHGVPAVAFRVPGLHDSVRDRITGWLVDPGDDLSACIAHALATLSEPDAAHAWAVRCRSWAAKFDWEESARRLAGIIVADRAQRARRRSDRRRTISDAACLVGIAAAPTRRLGDLAGGLRRTDLLSIQDNRARMILHGVDERDVGMALDRLDLAGAAISTAPATGYNLLVGPDLDADIALRADLAPTGTLAAT
jgi:glycosyltransferase involved in cell wall biosynthesis